MLCSHALQGAVAATGQPRLIGVRVQSREISHLEQFTYRPQPSPLKAPSLLRGWILGPSKTRSIVGLEVLLPGPELQEEKENVEKDQKSNFSQAHQWKKTVEKEREQLLAEGNGVTAKSIRNRNQRYEKKDADETILTKPKYVRGPDIDKRSFIRIYYISALRVPAAECWNVVFELRDHLLNWPRVNNIGRVPGDDVDDDLATVFLETSERKQDLTRDDIRAAVYAEAESGNSRKKPADDKRNRSSKQEVVRSREAATMLELTEEAENKFEDEDATAAGGVLNFRWSKKWIGPTRLLLLDEKYGGKDVSELPPALQAVYSRYGEFASRNGLVRCRLTIFYEYWSMDEVLRELLPAEAHASVKFYRAGHVAELILHPEHFPFRHLIAQVTLDKYKPAVRSVVVKRDKVDANGYAVQLELLAGSTSLLTTAWENEIPFRIDMATA